MRGYHHQKIDNLGAIGALRAGTRYDDDGGYTFYAVFPSAHFDRRTAVDALDDAGIYTTAYYGGPGMMFNNAAHARRLGSRILVTIRGGRDI